MQLGVHPCARIAKIAVRLAGQLAGCEGLPMVGRMLDRFASRSDALRSMWPKHECMLRDKLRHLVYRQCRRRYLNTRR